MMMMMMIVILQHLALCNTLLELLKHANRSDGRHGYSLVACKAWGLLVAPKICRHLLDEHPSKNWVCSLAKINCIPLEHQADRILALLREYNDIMMTRQFEILGWQAAVEHIFSILFRNLWKLCTLQSFAICAPWPRHVTMVICIQLANLRQGWC